MPEEESLQERTEEPTPRRREEARKRGQIVKSRELSSVAILGSGFLIFLFMGYFFFNQLYFIFSYSFSYFSVDFDLEVFFYFLKTIFSSTGKILLPFFIAISFAAVIVYLIQTGGGVWASEVIGFKFERINPVDGFKRLFSLTSLFELVKSLLKLAIIVGVTYFVLSSNLIYIIKLFGTDVNYLTFSLTAFLKSLMIKLLVVLAVLSIFDWLYNRWDVERKLKMTKEELKEELKQTEGDPQVKAKIRQKQREMARRRMLAEVPKADVVITNPTHYAVALEYKPKEMPAPKVIAKGKDKLALKIREIAKEHNIPIYEDPPLAQILYKKVEVGEFIPEELYQAVAKVLAYVYRLKNKKLF